MKNYLCINGKKIELSAEKLEELRASLSEPQTQLLDKKIGEIARIGEYEFIVLDQFGDSTALILKDLLQDDVKFGENNNDFRESNVLPILRDFAKVIEELVGVGNLLEHDVDLTSDDGLKDYGIIKEKMSLLTAENYRRYVDVLDMDRLEKYYWLATPYSTNRHENDRWVKCVSPAGGVDGNRYDCIYIGLRPFCILKSDIFVS